MHLEQVKTFVKGLNVILCSAFINSSKKVGTFFSSYEDAVVILKIIQDFSIHIYT